MPAALAKTDVVTVFMPHIFADCKVHGNRQYCSLPKDIHFLLVQTARMDNNKNGGPNYLRAWREYMRMTQEELAALCTPPTTGSVISLLEDGERGLSLKWLRRLAPALKTKPGFLAEFDPNNADTRTLDLISKLEPDQRRQVDRIIETFLRDGSNG
jgi:transcriptional regulator with XRE-family HTH domain